MQIDLDPKGHYEDYHEQMDFYFKQMGFHTQDEDNEANS